MGLGDFQAFQVDVFMFFKQVPFAAIQVVQFWICH